MAHPFEISQRPVQMFELVRHFFPTVVIGSPSDPIHIQGGKIIGREHQTCMTEEGRRSAICVPHLNPSITKAPIHHPLHLQSLGVSKDVGKAELEAPSLPSLYGI